MGRPQVLMPVLGLLLLQSALWAPPVFCRDGAGGSPAPEAAFYYDPRADSPGVDPGREESVPIEKGYFQFFPESDGTEAGSSALGRFLADIWTDQKAIWSSPARMSRRELFTIAVPLAAATAGLIATDSETSNWLPNSRAQVDWSQRFSAFGAIYTLGLVTGGPLIGGKVIDRPDYVRIGRNATEALVNSVVTSYALKGIMGRERPNAGAAAGDFWSGGQSFPSGHAMNSWAVAVAIARTPKCPRWFAVISYVMATSISASRWSAHKHFPSDILVGAVFGGLIGNYVAGRQR